MGTAGVVAVIAVGVLQSLFFVVKAPFSPRKGGIKAVSDEEVALSQRVPPAVLLAWRLAVFVLIVGVSIRQIVKSGTFPLKFYTVWNWYVLGLYFLLAAWATWRHMAAGERGKRQPKEHSRRVGPLGQAVVVLFHLNMTTVLLVDVICWTVLVPTLMASKDPEKVEIYRRLFYSFSSYCQHGGNAAFMFAELFVNRIPFFGHAIGYVGLWSSLYSAWAFLHYYLTGRWLYPFLDTSLPWAAGNYAGLYLAHFVFYGLVYAVHLLQQRLAPHPSPPSDQQRKQQ